MPKKRTNTPRKPKAVPSFDYESPEFLAQIDALAYEGFYNTEIADELKISRYELEMAISQCKKLRNTLEDARARAKAAGADMPSLAKFAKIWKECDGKRSKLMKQLGIGWTKFQQWCAQEPGFVDIMAMSDIEFLEQCDTVSRVLALGGVKDKDKFPGWNRYPSEWMLRFHMNTTGKKYGYGEAPILPSVEDLEIPDNIESGIDVAEWIKLEMTQKKGGEEK